MVSSTTKKGKEGSGAIITPKESKELKRVFDKLCYFAEKAPKWDRINIIQSELNELQREDGSSYKSTITKDDICNQTIQLQQELENIQKEIDEIKSRPEQVIRPQDTGIAMKTLGKRVSKREVQEFLWEVDEKVDGVVDWEEFNIMFERNIRDTSGLEPASFYNMVQFMIYDRDSNGMVSIDETMNMLYARLGRAKMESTISKLFGGEDGAPIKEVGYQGGEIDFERYLDVVEKEQTKLFNSSELGRTLAEKKKKK